MCLNSLSVGAGSLPLKPPMAMTALPLSRMNGAADCEPFTATRYVGGALVLLEVPH